MKLKDYRENLMNERIKELAEQAGLVRNGDIGMKRWEGPRSDSINDQDLEKFAELIVAECAEIGDNYQDILEDDPECFNCRKVAYGIVDKIKEHFGVEE